MSNRKLLRTILRLQSLKITDFRLMHRDTELHLAVKPYKNGCRCPACGRRGRIVHQTTEFRRWEDVAVLGLRVVLWYAPKEIQCPTHGRVQEEIPWAPPHARVTYRRYLEFFVGDLMGKALWKLVRFPRRGGRVLCVTAPSASTCDKMAPANWTAGVLGLPRE